MQYSLSKPYRVFRAKFTIDTRSLAVFRVFLGVLLISDVLLRARNFSRYYTDTGVTPYSVVAEINVFPTASLPIWELSTHPTFTAFIFFTAFLTGITLTIGYQTRLTTIIAFLTVSAIHSRNPFVLSYADFYYHLLLFWSIFLPLAQTWSIDALRLSSRSSQGTRTHFGFGTVAVLLQVITVYTANGFHKFTPHGIHAPRNLLYNLLHFDHVTYSYVTPLLGDFQLALQALSYVWAFMLITSILLLAVENRLRTLLLTAFISSHLIMALTTRIGAFPFVSIAGLCLFIQSNTWNTIQNNTHHSLLTRSQAFITIYSHITTIALTLARFQPQHETQQPIKHYAARTFTVLYLTLIVVSLLVSLGTVTGVGSFNTTTADHISQTITTIGIQQPPWDFFTTSTAFTEHWYVFNATTTTGQRIDVFNDRPPSSKRPYPASHLQKQYDNTYRDRFYLDDMVFRPPLTKAYVTQYCEHPPESVTGTITNITVSQYRQSYTAATAANRQARSTYQYNVGTYSCPQLPTMK